MKINFKEKKIILTGKIMLQFLMIGFGLFAKKITDFVFLQK